MELWSYFSLSILFCSFVVASLSLMERKWIVVQVLSPGPSVGQSVWWIVEKRLIGSGCHLGFWVGWV